MISKAISKKEFKNIFKKENPTVLDIRTPLEVANGKINKDALEINFYDPDFKNKLNSLDKEKTYLIYCARGNRSKETRKIMEEMNFKKIYDLNKGISEWKEDLT